MPTIGSLAPKGGVGKSTIAECLRQAFGDAQVVDLDHQQTLTILATLNDKPLPIKAEEATAKYIIYDTPPYNDIEIRNLMRILDRIIIPIKGGPPDLAAFPSVYESLKKTGSFDKTLVVFNEVRKPLTNVHKKVVEIFSKNFPKVKIAKTHLSNLNDFKTALFGELEGEGLSQIQSLVRELDI